MFFCVVFVQMSKLKEMLDALQRSAEVGDVPADAVQKQQMVLLKEERDRLSGVVALKEVELTACKAKLKDLEDFKASAEERVSCVWSVCPCACFALIKDACKGVGVLEFLHRRSLN